MFEINNDLTFFTNESERTLYDRFNKILKRDTQFFDVLVGYFMASGFHLLQDSLDNVEKTRILIGINTDKQVLEMYQSAQQEIKELSINTYNAKKQYKKSIIEEFKNSDDTEEVDKGVKKFIEMIKNGKLEVRVYTEHPIHAKLYVMRHYEDSSDYGKVITGSSNFSYNGLMNNLEFNVELKTSADVKFAYNKFEELWANSVEVSNECVETIQKETWVKNDITPYEMYLKFLYEYFKEEINDDMKFHFGDEYIADGFKLLEYQTDAVVQANRMLEKHNGVFISDVVGLGKTYICALLAKKIPGRKLFLVPPVLIDYWRQVLRDFGVRGFEVRSSGGLKRISEEKLYKPFNYVFVDEAHKFRNDLTESYGFLKEICTNKKVVLITATPQNNYITDIASQIYLFQSKTNSTIPGVQKLELFFDELRKEVNQHKGSDTYLKAIEQSSIQVRDRVLREVMLRRTRTEIQKNYKEDLEKQGLLFPKLNNPIKEVYEFDLETEALFEDTIKLIQELKYSRYKPLTYVKHEYLTNTMNTLLIGQQNMGSFMKGILVKRLESSKFAFSMTLERFIKSHKMFIKMFSDGEVWISRKLNINELLDREDFDTLLEGKKNHKAFSFKSEYFNKSFIEDLNKDLLILEDLKSRWDSLKIDNKLDFFINLLKTDSNLKNKVIIFSESKETVDYLADNIEDKLGRRVIKFSGSANKSVRDVIRNNFDPNIDKETQSDDYDVLVTTDILAEGMNLHRSNIIINYDLPWNPTRVMQRVGRINRVGTKHKELFVYNFFPTSHSDDLINQSENIVSKIQMFHNILGEDSKYLTEEESVSSHELFRKMNTLEDEEETGLNSELSYLKLIRDIRDNDEKLFNKIKKLPLKVKIGRSSDETKLLTFFRKGYVKRFFLSNEQSTEELNFDTAIKMIECDQNENAIEVNSNYYELLKINKEHFELSEFENEQEFSEVPRRQGTSNTKNLILLLKTVLKESNILTEDELRKCENIIKLLEDGELPANILKQANKKMNLNVRSPKDAVIFYKEFADIIPDTYFELIKENIDRTEENKEIILSELFMN